MNPSKKPIQGLILAGGQGRRLAGIDKGLLELSGQPLVQHVARTLGHQVSTVSVAANRSLSAYRQYAPQVLTDTVAGFAGPLAGLETFAPVAQSPWVAIVACDLIFLPDDWVSRLLRAARECNQKVVCATDETSGKHALCAIAQRETLATAARLLQRGKHRWIDWLTDNRAGSELFTAEALFNINSFDDANNAGRLLSKQIITV